MYPVDIYSPREKDNKDGVIYDPDQHTTLFAEDIVSLDSHVVAVEAYIGINDDDQSSPVEGAFLVGKSGGKSLWSSVISINHSTGVVTIINPNGNQHTLCIDSEATSANVIEIDSQNTSGNLLQISVAGVNRFQFRHDGAEIISCGTGASFATRVNFFLFTRRDYQTSYINKISNSMSGTVANSTMNFEVCAGASTTIPVMTLNGLGHVGIGTGAPSCFLDVNSDTIRIETSRTITNSTDSGNAGDICWDSNYLYICVATDTWKRAALSTW